MANYVATECCGCGASVIVEARTEEDLGKRLTEWRSQHKHDLVSFTDLIRRRFPPVDDPVVWKTWVESEEE